MLRRFFASFGFIALLISPTFAGISEGRTWFATLQDDTKFLVQANLVLVGLYDRLIDGDYGSGTFRAIAAYQSRLGKTPDGVLTAPEMRQLSEEAAEVFGRLGFTKVEDPEAKITVFVPLKLLEIKSPSNHGFKYSSADGGIALQTQRTPFSERSFQSLFGTLGSTNANRTVTYSAYDAAVFTVSGRTKEQIFYTRYYDDQDSSVGFTLRWTDRYAEVGTMVAIMIANMSSPTSLEVSEPPPEEEVPHTADGPAYTSGSGFIFSAQGLVATNYHVAGDCTALNVPGYGHASLVRGDESVDLAVIQLESQRAASWATIRSAPLELAENVVLLGYPLADILNSSLNVATGIVSSETGIGGNADWFTTNAGIQPGNSGGPILDLHGNVVGVAVAKIDDAKLLAATGDTAPNVGFGINNRTLLKFLRIFQHSEIARGMGDNLSAQSIAKLAKEFTVQIVCQQRS